MLEFGAWADLGKLFSSNSVWDAKGATPISRSNIYLAHYGAISKYIVFVLNHK